MKLLAILFNVALIIFLVVTIAQEGIAKQIKPGEFLGLSLVILTPVINLLYIFIWSGESWLSLYFKRKAMEEKRKIEKLSDKE